MLPAGLFGSLLMDQSLLEANVEQQLAELREFLAHKRVSKGLTREVREFMLVLYRKRTGYDEQKVIQSLPPGLAKKLIAELYLQSVQNVPLFRGLQEEAVVKICYALKPLHLPKGNNIFKESSLGQELFIIEKGMVRLSRSGITLSRIGPGAFFGEAAMQPGRHLRFRTAEALTDVELTFVTKEDIMPIAQNYPYLMERINALSHRRQLQDAERLASLVDETALSLGVEPGSAAMTQVMATVANMSLPGAAAAGYSDDVLPHVLKIQTRWRGWHTRKKLGVNKNKAMLPGMHRTRFQKAAKTSALVGRATSLAPDAIKAAAERIHKQMLEVIDDAATSPTPASAAGAPVHSARATADAKIEKCLADIAHQVQTVQEQLASQAAQLAALRAPPGGVIGYGTVPIVHTNAAC
eukprot:SAG22_NODE_110_length_19679_cov_45.046527_7_plen_410_part_00